MEFTIIERTEPFTLDEVFQFIDDTNISKLDACELKSRIVDMLQAEKNKVIDDFAERLRMDCLDSLYHEVHMIHILKVADQLKGGE